MASSNWDGTSAQRLGALGELPFAADLTALLEPFRFPGADLGALLEWQRDDWDALLQAQREAFEGLMVLFERRSEMLQKWLLRWQEGLAGAGGPQAWNSPMALWQASLGQALDDFQELAQMEVQARAGAWQVLQDRLQANLVRLQGPWQLR